MCNGLGHQPVCQIVFNKKAIQGFTLFELIAVLVIVGIVSVAVASRGFSNDVFLLQAAKDDVVAMLTIAQQHALSQQAEIRVQANGEFIDIRKDLNADNVFSADESLRHGTVRYPVKLPRGVRILPIQLDFDRLGQTSPSKVILQKQRRRIVLNISATGFVSL